MSQKQSRLGTDGTYRQILNNFGSGGDIQGTEDVPFDTSKKNAKLIGAAVLIGFATVAVLPDDYAVLGWVAAAILIVGAIGVIYVSSIDRAPDEWLRAMVTFKRRPKRLTQYAETPRERTQTITQVERCLFMSDAVWRRDGTLVGAVKVEGRDMALAEPPEWDLAASDFADLAAGLDGGFEVFLPARRIRPSNMITDTAGPSGVAGSDEGVR